MISAASRCSRACARRGIWRTPERSGRQCSRAVRVPTRLERRRRHRRHRSDCERGRGAARQSQLPRRAGTRLRARLSLAAAARPLARSGRVPQPVYGARLPRIGHALHGIRRPARSSSRSTTRTSSTGTPSGLEGLGGCTHPSRGGGSRSTTPISQMSLTPLRPGPQPRSLRGGLDAAADRARRAVLLRPAAQRRALRRSARPVGHSHAAGDRRRHGRSGIEELDLNAIWQATPRLTVSLEGRSLLHSSHVEFGGPQERSAIERSVFGRLTWGF